MPLALNSNLKPDQPRVPIPGRAKLAFQLSSIGGPASVDVEYKIDPQWDVQFADAQITTPGGQVQFKNNGPPARGFVVKKVPVGMKTTIEVDLGLARAPSGTTPAAFAVHAVATAGLDTCETSCLVQKG